MKLTKSKLKQIIKEEMFREDTDKEAAYEQLNIIADAINDAAARADIDPGLLDDSIHDLAAIRNQLFGSEQFDQPMMNEGIQFKGYRVKKNRS